MLLDSYALKKGLMEVPMLNTDGSQPSAAFVKRATQSTAKIDSLLKTLQVRPSPPEALVQAYLIHIADRSDANFRKILELKGTRRQDQNSLVDLFNAHCMAPNNMTLPASSAWLTQLQISTTSHAANATSAIKEAATTPAFSGNRFDPANFGTSLINAAREGVDRLGTPNLGTSGQPGPESSVVDGHTANLNEGLKNFGKLFRREGGFGRFSRTGAGTGPESGSASR